MNNETPNQRKRRYRREFSELVRSLISEKKQPPALVADLAKHRMSEKWAKEFGEATVQDWFPEEAKAN